MTKEKAYKIAKFLSKKHTGIVYVIRDYDDHFDTATNYDLNTFFIGCEPLAAFESGLEC